MSRAGGWIVRSIFNLGVAILYLLLLWAISTQIAPSPDPSTFTYPVVDTQQRCEAEGGTWRTDGLPEKPIREPHVAPTSPDGQPRPYCQGPLRVEREREAQERHATKVSFFVFVIGGAVSLVAAVPLLQFTPVAPGFLVAGVVGLLISTSKLWQFAGNLARLMTIVVLLIVVVAAGGYFFRDRKTGN